MLVCVEVRPSSPTITYSDVEEHHGPWVQIRKAHTVKLPQAYRLGCDLITNVAYRDFVRAGGYEREGFWRKSGRQYPAASDVGREDTWFRLPGLAPKSSHSQGHLPVTGISFVEAQAFV